MLQRPAVAANIILPVNLCRDWRLKLCPLHSANAMAAYSVSSVILLMQWLLAFIPFTRMLLESRSLLLPCLVQDKRKGAVSFIPLTH